MIECYHHTHNNSNKHILQTVNSDILFYKAFIIASDVYHTKSGTQSKSLIMYSHVKSITSSLSYISLNLPIVMCFHHVKSKKKSTRFLADSSVDDAQDL